MGRTAWRHPPLVLFIGLICLPRPVAAYSVLAHETVVDAAWDDRLVPLLRQRFPGATAAGLQRARAYAYTNDYLAEEPNCTYTPVRMRQT